MARRLFSSTARGSFGGVGMSGSQFTSLVSVATVVDSARQCHTYKAVPPPHLSGGIQQLVRVH
jgi:hypothetical protein